MNAALVVLARSPVDGEGKTRLRAQLNRHPGHLVDRLVAAMIEDTLAWALAGRPLVIAACGDAGRLRRLAPGAHHVEQPDTGFGERIEHAVDTAFLGGQRLGPGRLSRRRVLQVGTDSPTLPAALLESAAAALRGPDDAVLIPAEDGGWVGLGVARPLAGALAGSAIRWSTAGAAADTAAALVAAGRCVTVLRPWYDIDGEDGLRSLRADATAAARAPRTVAALRALDATVGVHGR